MLFLRQVFSYRNGAEMLIGMARALGTMTGSVAKIYLLSNVDSRRWNVRGGAALGRG